MYGCPGCGSFMTYDIQSGKLKCGRCDRTEEIETADRREARTAGNKFSVDLLTCPTCGAGIQAVNTASAAFCSYCGASVMLERRDADMTAPDTVAPFRVTREECFAKFREMTSKSLCADHRLKKDVTPESFRGIYIPFYEYAGSVQGSAELEGTHSHGNVTDYFKTTVALNHRFSHILHDASKEMPDAMSEKISKVPQDAFRPFTPAYLSGFYADMPDAEQEAYLPYAKAETVRNGLNDVIADLKDGCTYSTSQAEKKLVPLAEAHCTGQTLIPVWFMSIRSKGRILYAVQNGVTGEMVADMPMDIPRFGLITLIAAIPIFFLLNLFLTLRPEMVMAAAMALAVAAQAIINLRQSNLKDQKNAELAAEGQDDFSRRLKQRRKAERSAKTAAAAGSVIGPLSGLSFAAVAAAVLYFMSRQDDVSIFKLAALALTAVMAVLLLIGSKGGGRVIPGSAAALLAMIAGTAVLILDPFHSADMPVYLISFLILATVIWECVDLLKVHNKACSNPLPQFTTHQGGEDHA